VPVVLKSRPVSVLGLKDLVSVLRSNVSPRFRGHGLASSAIDQYRRQKFGLSFGLSLEGLLSVSRGGRSCSTSLVDRLAVTTPTRRELQWNSRDYHRLPFVCSNI